MAHVKAEPWLFRWTRALVRTVHANLAPRNILVREEGGFRQRRVHPMRRLLALGLNVLVLGWAAWTTYAWITTSRIAAERAVRVAEIEEAHDEIAAILADHAAAVKFLNARLDADLASKDELVTRNAGLHARVVELELELERSMTDVAALQQELSVSRSLGESLRGRLGDATGEAEALRVLVADLTTSLERLRADYDGAEVALSQSEPAWAQRLAEAQRRHAQAMADARAAHALDVAAMDGRLAEIVAEAEERVGTVVADAAERVGAVMAEAAERIASAQADARAEVAMVRAETESRLIAAQVDLEALGLRIADLEAERSGLLRDVDTLVSGKAAAEQHVARLEQDLTQTRSQHEMALRRIQERTETEISTVEAALADTGLNLSSLLSAKAPRSGQGGPYVPWIEGGTERSPVMDAIKQLEARMEYKERLAALQVALPLRPPVEDVSISSSFGKRSDPKSGRIAFHEGLDFRGKVGTPVLAAGAGTVVYAGWYGDYGRMVEIDHGYGIRTRYAHLQKVEVRKGDTVEPNAKIGLLGNSGRSTGPHLHYEILIKNDPVDPTNFMKVGQNVCKG